MLDPKVCRSVALFFAESVNSVLVTYILEIQRFYRFAIDNEDAMCSPDSYGNNGNLRVILLFPLFIGRSEGIVECSPYGWRDFATHVSKYASSVALLWDFTAIRLGRHSRRSFAAAIGFLTSDRWFTREDLLLVRFYKRLWPAPKPAWHVASRGRRYTFRKRKIIFYNWLRAASLWWMVLSEIAIPEYFLRGVDRNSAWWKICEHYGEFVRGKNIGDQGNQKIKQLKSLLDRTLAFFIILRKM